MFEGKLCESRLFKVFALLACLLPFEILANTNLRIVFLGDSITAGYGIENTDSYVSLIQQKLTKQYPQSTIEIIQEGISGSTSSSALARLKWQLRKKPQILMLALGANDGLRALSVKAMKNNLSQTIELAHKNNITVMLLGMKSLPNYGVAYSSNFEKSFQELSKEYTLDFMPFLLEGVAGEPKLNLPDGIHPNEKGHEIIAERIFDFLIKRLKETYKNNLTINQ